MLKRPRQIIAIGGGMFSMEPDNGLLDKYILNLVPKAKPKICFLGTASNDGIEYREMFYNFFDKLPCIPTHLSFLEPPKNIEKFILEQDIIHVGGGNTKLIMETWKKFRVDKIMRKAWNEGIILTGMSAGAICWFEDGITNPSPGELRRLQCLGFLKGSFCPHYDDRVELRQAYQKLILNGILKDGYGVEDGAAIHFIENMPAKVITSRPNAKAFKVRKYRNRISELQIDSIYLGKISDLEQSAVTQNNEDVLNTAVSFIENINKHDLDGLFKLMTDDHKFIDSMGIVISGKREMRKAWQSYFKWFPDYNITLLHTLLTDDSVAFFGIAKGTFDSNLTNEGNKFEIPASWRAKIKDKKISEWQAIADNEVVRDILTKHDKLAFIKAQIESRLIRK
ncbi:MAG: hypothetical protein HGGPFJEG_00190 [Ignavibacteria bacterium]|nr:hypothetical protein [Ignavibacteria bacterium]